MEPVPVDAKLDINQTFVIQVRKFNMPKFDNMNNQLENRPCFTPYGPTFSISSLHICAVLEGVYYC